MFNLIQRIVALFTLILLAPFFVFIFFLVKSDSPGPFIFKQKRAGKHKKPFTIYKIRTMVKNAENLKNKYRHINEADGPVFKIRNDPRFTRIGKILARTAIDELPQLVNVIKGEMTLVGPRPLPVSEAKLIPKKYEERFSILPGMTSSWVVAGSHRLKFKQWMELDLKYVKNKGLWYDTKILILTISLIVKLLIFMPIKDEKI